MARVSPSVPPSCRHLLQRRAPDPARGLGPDQSSDTSSVTFLSPRGRTPPRHLLSQLGTPPDPFLLPTTPQGNDTRGCFAFPLPGFSFLGWGGPFFLPQLHKHLPPFQPFGDPSAPHFPPHPGQPRCSGWRCRDPSPFPRCSQVPLAVPTSSCDISLSPHTPVPVSPDSPRFPRSSPGFSRLTCPVW